MKKILVIAVHPDDETLGCGGTLLKHKATGDEIYWCIVTSIKEKLGFSDEQVILRSKEIEKVAGIYGFNGVEQLAFPTMQLDQLTMGELIDGVSTIIKKIQPHTIYLPFKNDVHSDHRIAFEAIYSCTKTFRYPFIRRILMMETISETEFAPALPAESFVPNVFADISEFIDQKIDIFKIYASELGEHPFPRSEKNIRALACLRGASADCESAESFMLLKEIL